MRKRFALLCLLLVWMLPTMVQAQSILLPEAIQNVFDGTEWEGYEAIAQAGYGGNDDFASQYALIMKKGEHNVLCILEAEPGATEFQFAVQTDRAIYQGDLLPSLLMDTGGDALFYTYRYDEGLLASEMYGSIKQNGAWGVPTLFLYYNADEDGLYPETQVFSAEGRLFRDTVWCDENGNIVKHGGRESIVDTTLAITLADFEIAAWNTSLGEW